jgi:arylsulfatase
MGQSPDIDAYKGGLYSVAEDFSEAWTLPTRSPRSSASCTVLDRGAKYNILPLDNSRIERFDVSIRPSLTRGRNVFTYYAGRGSNGRSCRPSVDTRRIV